MTLDLNKLKNYFFKDEHDFKNVFSHVKEPEHLPVQPPIQPPIQPVGPVAV